MAVDVGGGVYAISRRLLGLFLILLLVACGGGGGGGSSNTNVSADIASLQFRGSAGAYIAAQNINVTLTQASGTVYPSVSSSDPSVAIAGLNITSGTTASITVTPSQNKPSGTYSTTIYLNIYSDPAGTKLVTSLSYPISLTVLRGLAVNPTTIILSALEGGATQTDVAVTAPEGSTGTITASVASGQSTPSWLGLTVLNNNTVHVTASASGLIAGSYSTAIDVSFTSTGGTGITVVQVPLSFTVGQGLVTPTGQTLPLNVDSTQTSLSGAVSVARADGAAATWSASSSAPWLVLSVSSGTTPSNLGYSVDVSKLTNLPQFTDSTAIVTLSSPGISSVNFNVVLQKHLPYVTSVGPYGIDANSTARVVVGGVGFSQLVNPAAALQLSGVSARNVRVVTDKQIVFDTTPASSGTFNIGIANALNISVPTAALVVTAPVTYTATTVPHAGPKDIYIHDPVRHAVFALSRTNNALYRYMLTGGTWAVTAMPLASPLDMGLTPDGRRLWITNLNQQLVEVDPDNLTVLFTYANGAISQSLGSALPITSDGRLWIPGSAQYFDLATKTFAQLNVNLSGPSFDFGSFAGAADGSMAITIPSYRYTPLAPFLLYDPSTGLLSNPTGMPEFGYQPRISRDGSLILKEYSGELYDRSFHLLGQLPTPTATDSWRLMTLSPDGSKILVQHNTYTNSSHNTLVSMALDVYSTTALVPGTTNFVNTASIPLSTDVALCTNSSPCYYNNTYLLPSTDSKAVFWIGNVNMQVIPLP
jgi:hypothetical protein